MGLRILVVEDNAANLELIRYLLSAAGHEVITAVNGRDGLNRATLEVPDLVLCDLQMPVMDGYELMRALRNIPALHEIVCIALSASAMPSDAERVAAAGFNAYLTKPLEPETFARQVMELYDRSSDLRL